MNDFRKAREYLDSFINYENRNDYHYRGSFKLKRVRRLMDILGISYKSLKVIHVAGTKGKGSTATFVSYMLAASGFKTGLYTSPHFVDFRERTKIVIPHGRNVREDIISKEDVVRIINDFRPYLERMRFNPELGRLTFFEIYTALSLKFFLEKKVDYAVLEVGLGGRLDATNIVHPAVSIITHIGYDHTQKLGEKLGEIAREKAGIIKRNVPVVISSQRKSALSVIQRKARLKKAESFLLGRDFYFYNVRLALKTTFDFRFKDFKLRARIPLRGMRQVENASLAIAAVHLLDKKYAVKGIDYKKGLKETYLEGRFETALKEPLIILDIAHNVSSFRALNQSIKDYFPKKKIILIFGASKDKNVKQMLSVIDYDRIIITSFGNPRALDPHRIKEFCNKTAVLEPSVEKALKKALSYYNKGCLILVSGSFFLAAEAKEAIKKIAPC